MRLFACVPLFDVRRCDYSICENEWLIMAVCCFATKMHNEASSSILETTKNDRWLMADVSKHMSHHEYDTDGRGEHAERAYRQSSSLKWCSSREIGSQRAMTSVSSTRYRFNVQEESHSFTPPVVEHERRRRHNSSIHERNRPTDQHRRSRSFKWTKERTPSDR